MSDLIELKSCIEQNTGCFVEIKDRDMIITALVDDGVASHWRVFLSALKSPQWNQAHLEKVYLKHFLVDLSDDGLWGDLYCYRWLYQRYGVDCVKDVVAVRGRKTVNGYFEMSPPLYNMSVDEILSLVDV